jgi:hypothetical protein
MCFKCGRVGHCAKDCQQVTTRIQVSQASNNYPRPIAPARVYNMFAQENVKADKGAANAATSTIPFIS